MSVFLYDVDRVINVPSEQNSLAAAPESWFTATSFIHKSVNLEISGSLIPAIIFFIQATIYINAKPITIHIIILHNILITINDVIQG